CSFGARAIFSASAKRRRSESGSVSRRLRLRSCFAPSKTSAGGGPPGGRSRPRPPGPRPWVRCWRPQRWGGGHWVASGFSLPGKGLRPCGRFFARIAVSLHGLLFLCTDCCFFARVAVSLHGFGVSLRRGVSHYARKETGRPVPTPPKVLPHR